MNFLFKIGFLDRSPRTIYDPVRNAFTGLFVRYYNKQLELYSSINYTIVLVNQTDFGDCDSVNCTGLIGHIQRGEIDLSERFYSFKTIPNSIAGLKPGPVIGDVSCNIVSFLPEVATMREDVFKSLSMFTSDAIIFLAFLFLFLFSTPFLLWYCESKFFNIKSNTSTSIWSLIHAILSQRLRIETLFYRQSLSFIWIAIILTLFFLTALYSSSFTTDLTSKAPIKTIDSLEDVANSDRIPLWMEEPRGQYKRLGHLVDEITETKGIGKYVFIINVDEIYNVQLSCCLYNSESLPQWYQSTGSLPVQLLFSVLNSKLPPYATKIVNLLHEKRFESGVVFHIQSIWKLYLDKKLDPEQKFGCLHKTSISPTPALYP
uniref:Ionotropic glutamate receptor C-terminal domain-containing protein n=1 Tax=Tetranychus urticae TaxID=32264 RepID=T1JZM5_TETUR